MKKFIIVSGDVSGQFFVEGIIEMPTIEQATEWAVKEYGNNISVTDLSEIKQLN